MRNTELFTIGYGQRSMHEFIQTLHQFSITTLIDVRSKPYSRYRPEFCKAPLSDSIVADKIRYLFMGHQLGGQPDDPLCLTNGKVDYAKCREQPAFLDGIQALKELCKDNERIALMCCESKPETCHRTHLVGEYLHTLKIKLQHIDEHNQLISQQQAVFRVTQGQIDLFG